MVQMVFLIDIRDMPNLSKHRIQQVSILFFYILFHYRHILNTPLPYYTYLGFAGLYLSIINVVQNYPQPHRYHYRRIRDDCYIS